MAATPHDACSVPRLLVSVRDAAEARLAAEAGADLVDAKDPEDGPLGALPPEHVSAILAAVAGRALTSAVAEPQAVAAMAGTGADYVKVAAGPLLREGGLADAASAARGRLVAVLFAEDGIPPGAVVAVAAAGCTGAMLDTRGKAGRRLTDLLGRAELTGFVAACREARLLCGLAGSLALSDIPTLTALGPDYLGFRGGLCFGSDRRGGLDPERVREAAERLRAPARSDAA